MRSERSEQIESGLGLFHQPVEERFIDPVHVLERVQDREARLDAQQDRGVAMADVHIDQEHLAARGTRERDAGVHREGRGADAALDADERHQLPELFRVLRSPGRGARRPASASGVIGSWTHSVTPARIASSISRGSSVDVTSTTPLPGCCLRNAPRPAGSWFCPRASRTSAAGRAILAGLAEIGGPNARDLQARRRAAPSSSRGSSLITSTCDIALTSPAESEPGTKTRGEMVALPVESPGASVRYPTTSLPCMRSMKNPRMFTTVKFDCPVSLPA